MDLPRHAVDFVAIDATLETSRLRLEPIGARHAAWMYEGMRDPALYEWISMAPPESIEQLAQRWGRLPGLRAQATTAWWYNWAVQRHADGAWIGELDIEVTTDAVATNVGYFFLPAYWGRGHASEAVAALCDHLARCGVVRQVATVTDGNVASCRVLERAGFAFTRVLAANDTLRGVPVDDLEFVRVD